MTALALVAAVTEPRGYFQGYVVQQCFNRLRKEMGSNYDLTYFYHFLALWLSIEHCGQNNKFVGVQNIRLVLPLIFSRINLLLPIKNHARVVQFVAADKGCVGREAGVVPIVDVIGFDFVAPLIHAFMTPARFIISSVG